MTHPSYLLQLQTLKLQVCRCLALAGSKSACQAQQRCPSSADQPSLCRSSSSIDEAAKAVLSYLLFPIPHALCQNITSACLCQGMQKFAGVMHRERRWPGVPACVDGPAWLQAVPSQLPRRLPAVRQLLADQLPWPSGRLLSAVPQALWPESSPVRGATVVAESLHMCQASRGLHGLAGTACLALTVWASRYNQLCLIDATEIARQA